MLINETVYNIKNVSLGVAVNTTLPNKKMVDFIVSTNAIVPSTKKFLVAPFICFLAILSTPAILDAKTAPLITDLS